MNGSRERVRLTDVDVGWNSAGAFLAKFKIHLSAGAISSAESIGYFECNYAISTTVEALASAFSLGMAEVGCHM